MARVGGANGSLLPLASLLAGWAKVPGDIPPDFVTSPSPMSSPLQVGSRFSGFPHTSAPGTFWTPEVSGGWRGWGLECSESHKGTAGSLLLLLRSGSPRFRCPPGALGPLRADISAARWHCDPAEWQWIPELMVSGESSPPPPAQHNNLCMGCVPLAPRHYSLLSLAPQARQLLQPENLGTQFRAYMPMRAQWVWGLPFTSLEQDAQVGGH